MSKARGRDTANATWTSSSSGCGPIADRPAPPDLRPKSTHAMTADPAPPAGDTPVSPDPTPIVSPAARRLRALADRLELAAPPAESRMPPAPDGRFAQARLCSAG